MKIAQLKSLVKHGESETLEFKHSTGSITAGMQTICAFLNSDHGGTVIFGVSDKGQIVGQAVTDKTKKEIAIELNKIEPRTKIDVKYVRVTGDRQAIVLFANPGDQAPYTYDGRPFVRNQSTTMRMPKDEYIYLHNKNSPIDWEGLTNNKCTLNDLDRNRIKEVVRTGVFEKRLPESAMQESIPEILKKLELLQDSKLTNAAVVLFCKKENKQFMQSNIKLARFRGIDKTEFLDNKVYRANIFDLYEKAMDFLVFALPLAARIEPGNPNRVETPAIPYTVLREALINALVHRDYSHAGGSISVAVYDDRVNISNTGGLPSGLRVSQLSKAHQSVPRNPVIANVMYVCKKIEKWGRGTLDMITDCKKAGLPLPEYEEVGGGFSVTLHLKEPIRTIIMKQAYKNGPKLTARQKEIIDILKQGPSTRQEIMSQMTIVITDRVMQLELAKLKKMRIIQSEGKGKSIVWALSNY